MMATATHLAWITVVALAWSWAIAQFIYAWRDRPWWPVPWRLKVTVWLTAKDMLFTYLLVVTWDAMAAMPHALVAWLFAAIHAWVFLAWLRLPPSDAPQPTERPP